MWTLITLLIFFIQFTNGLFFLKKKKTYDPFEFHQYIDFYGQYSLRNGQKVYSYCFDVRFNAKNQCQPPWQPSYQDQDHFHPYQGHHHHHHFHHHHDQSNNWNQVNPDLTQNNWTPINPTFFRGNSWNDVSQLMNKVSKAIKRQAMAT